MSVNDVDGNLADHHADRDQRHAERERGRRRTISAANGSSTLTLSGTQPQINAALAGLSYQGNLNFNGADTLTVLSTGDGTRTDSDTVAITVSSVNDGPVNTVPGAQTVNEDTRSRSPASRSTTSTATADHHADGHQRHAERERGRRRDDQRGPTAARR